MKLRVSIFFYIIVNAFRDGVKNLNGVRPFPKTCYYNGLENAYSPK